MNLVCCPGNLDRSQCVELTEREYSVCSLVCGASEPVSFTELRRSTQFHQEILSRIVRRLVVYGIVKKSDDGRYRSALK